MVVVHPMQAEGDHLLEPRIQRLPSASSDSSPTCTHTSLTHTVTDVLPKMDQPWKWTQPTGCSLNHQCPEHLGYVYGWLQLIFKLRSKERQSKQLYTIAWERLCAVVGCHMTGSCARFVTHTIFLFYLYSKFPIFPLPNPFYPIFYSFILIIWFTLSWADSSLNAIPGLNQSWTHNSQIL